ncbi:hypothetical protein COOONC_06940 [Cooperia oncophora]
MIKKKLDSQIGQLHDVLMPSLRTECELEVLRKECDRQRHLIGALETEVFGARLAAKYLDKVIVYFFSFSDLFLHKKNWPAVFNKFSCWDGICVGSSMTVCGISWKRKFIFIVTKPSSERVGESLGKITPPPKLRVSGSRSKPKGLPTPPMNECSQPMKRRRGVGDTRKVVLAKQPHEGLGISITVSMGII